MQHITDFFQLDSQHCLRLTNESGRPAALPSFKQLSWHQCATSKSCQPACQQHTVSLVASYMPCAATPCRRVHNAWLQALHMKQSRMSKKHASMPCHT